MPTIASFLGSYFLNMKHDIVCNERNDLMLKMEGVDNLWLELTMPKTNIHYIIGAIYRHPNSNINEFMNNLEPSLNIISNQKKPSLIVGDINIDLAKFDSNTLTGDYLNLMLTNNFMPRIILSGSHFCSASYVTSMFVFRPLHLDVSRQFPFGLENG